MLPLILVFQSVHVRCTWFLQFAERAHSSSRNRSEILPGMPPNPSSTFGAGLYLPLSQNSKLVPLICRVGTEALTCLLELNWDKNALTARIRSVTLSQPTANCPVPTCSASPGFSSWQTAPWKLLWVSSFPQRLKGFTGQPKTIPERKFVLVSSYQPPEEECSVAILLHSSCSSVTQRIQNSSGPTVPLL